MSRYQGHPALTDLVFTGKPVRYGELCADRDRLPGQVVEIMRERGTWPPLRGNHYR